MTGQHPQLARRGRLKLALLATVVAVAALSAVPAAASAELTVSAQILSLGCDQQSQVIIRASGFPEGTVNAGASFDNGNGYYTAGAGPITQSGELITGFGSSNGFPAGTYTVTVFVDENLDLQPDPGTPTATTTVSFCLPTEPVTKEDCAKDKFKDFPAATNHGDCVSFVSTGGRNELGKNVPGAP